jgi:hypothetical protein
MGARWWLAASATCLIAALLLSGSATASYIQPESAYTGTTIDVWSSSPTPSLVGTTVMEIGLLHCPFKVTAPGHAYMTIPANAVSGVVQFIRSDGVVGSIDYLDIAPKITSFTPISGTASTTITVNGSGFGPAGSHPTVKVGGKTASVQVLSPNTIKVEPYLPWGAASGSISISFAGHWQTLDATSSASFTLLPSFQTGANPAAKRGDAVTLEGSGFQSASSVSFGSVPATSFTVSPDGESIDTTVPAGALTAPVTVVTPQGKAVSPPFHVLPTITEPGSPPLGEGPTGSTLVLNGEAFTGTTSVKVGGVAALFKVLSDASISLTIPAGAVTDPVAVTTPGGTTTTADDYVVDPTITSFTPTSAKAGAIVTLNGSGFGASGETRDVEVGGVASTTVTWKSPKQVLFVVPVGARTGQLSIGVTGTDTAESSGTLAVLPNVLGYDQPTYEIGDPVTIEGNALDGASAVDFGTVPASFSVAGDGDSISTTVPAGALTGAVKVTTPSGILTGPAIHIVPTLDPLPAAHGLVGTVLAVSGAAFIGTTHVTVGGATATFKVVGPTSLNVTVPSNAVSGHLAVTNAGGTTTSSDSFVVDPQIASFTPATANGANPITVIGSGLGAVGETRDIEIGGVPADSVTWISPTKITFVPGVGSHTGQITVNVSSGPVTAHSATNLIVPPSVVGYDASTYQAGDPVTIEGSNLDGATELKFGTVVVTSGFTVAGDGNSIDATVPSGAVTAPVTVFTPNGNAVGPALHVVPTITNVSPTDADVGATVTLTGNTFTGTTAVHFGPATATFHVVGPTSLTTVVPAGAATGPISVTNAGGTTASSQTFTPHPKITGFSVTGAATGDTIVIDGSGLDAVTDVEFAGPSGQLSASIVSATPTTLHVVVPDSAEPGTVSVQSPVGTASSPKQFDVTFSVTGITYDDAPSGEAVGITGIGFTSSANLELNGFFISHIDGVTVLGPTAIVFTVPDSFPFGNPNGTLTITQGDKTARLAQPFHWLHISSRSPLAPAAGSTLTLNGSGFLEATYVSFPTDSGPVKVTTFDVNSDGTSLTVVVPTGYSAGGGVDVAISPTLLASIELDGEYIYNLSADSGAVGATITINGGGFTNVTDVSFNGTPATTYSVNSVNEITVTVPAGATTGPVTVTGDGGTCTSPSDFTVTP